MKRNFQKFPYLNVEIALEPVAASKDFAVVLKKHVLDNQSAAFILQRLIDSGRKAGVQVFLTVEHPESALPEAHRLTSAILSLPLQDDIYFTPQTTNYQPNKFYSLFGLEF
ncbi:hypothetical protein PQ469_03395 [Mucilaginibacter sp. KACC 22773]|uniref:hypothetical protein n=1 Tax=Mucilaginibacter sp. KACC 22773 TaxID=3025671 RepID=UPI002365E507|nr:hypothetical protein [Mucilaginibacter sp. KACC 22773]WDF79050.1 hypothetical protein PQ469_03395 [Mucilaginibacter sp. KACC 22773]